MKKIIFIHALLFLLCHQMYAQERTKDHAVFFNLGKQNTTGAPLYNLFSKPFNINFEAGYEWIQKKDRKLKYFQSVNLGWINSKYSHMGLKLSSALGYRFITGLNVFIDMAIEIGAQQTFHKEAVFKFEDGSYSQTRDGGKLFGLVGGHFSLGFSLSKSKNPIDIFIQYNPTLLVPYPDLGILPQEVLDLGIRIKINKKSK